MATARRYPERREESSRATCVYHLSPFCTNHQLNYAYIKVFICTADFSHGRKASAGSSSATTRLICWGRWLVDSDLSHCICISASVSAHLRQACVCVCAFVKCTPGLFAYSRHFGNWIQLATAKRWDSRARLIGAADPYNVLTAYDCASRTGRWKLETRDRGPGSLVLWLSRASGRGPQLSRTFLGTPKRNYSYKCGEGAKCLGQQNNMQMPMNEFQLGKKTMRMTHECW